MVTLITALVTLGYRVVRQVILPTLTRKGNLLSSLFVLFTDLTELVIGFAETVARVPRTFEIPAKLDCVWAFSRKYLRQGMLIAAWALFILSSVEWTCARPSATEQTTVEQTTNASARISQRVVPAKDDDPDMAFAPQPMGQLLINPPPASNRLWLLLCDIRI